MIEFFLRRPIFASVCSLVILLIGLVSIHLLAALYHHFVVKDRVLARMLPSR